MATLTDYIVIQDNRSDRIEINEEEFFTFNLPSNVDFNNGSRKPIMAFRYDPSSDANNLTLEVTINNHSLTTISNIDSGTELTYWEAFNGEKLNPVDDNTVLFRVEGNNGRGNMRVSDVIIWFQRSGF